MSDNEARSRIESLKAFGYRQAMRAYYLAMWPYSTLKVDAPDIDFYYLGHHKCASHWIRWFLFYLAPVVQANYQIYRGRDFANFTSRRLRRTFHLYVNSDVDVFRSVPNEARGFHVIRDPRDVLVSDYFSRKNSHAVLNEWHREMREYLRSHSKEEGLTYLMEEPSFYQQVEGWEIGSRVNILDVKYEDLLEDEYGEFKSILDHLGIAIPPARLRKIVRKCSFESLSGGRQPGQEDKAHHYRKGVAGDWRNHMPVDGEVYKEFVKRWGDLTERLGYRV